MNNCLNLIFFLLINLSVIIHLFSLHTIIDIVYNKKFEFELKTAIKSSSFNKKLKYFNS